jgi:hypothetical protein
MMDVNYFVNEAGYRSQDGFEFVHANVITVFDRNSTTLITEDKKVLTINWDMSGRSMKSYSVEAETSLMKSHPGMVEDIISMLKHMDVDGDTMQYILKNVAMEEQMLNQLAMSQPMETVINAYGERVYAERCKVY